MPLSEICSVSGNFADITQTLQTYIGNFEKIGSID